MFSSPTLLSYILLAVSVVSISGAPAFPIAGNARRSLDFTPKVRAVGLTNIAETDRARANALRAKALGISHAGSRREPVEVDASVGVSVSTTDYNVDAQNGGVHYTTTVGVGSPATQYTLLIDTGSSNTWVGAGKAYAPTSTSEKTDDQVSVEYGSGSFQGDEWIDRVTLSPDLVINKQSIGVATKSKGLEGVDGILGVGPVDLTVGTLSHKSETIPTVVDNLYSDGTIPENSLGIFFAPYAATDSTGTLSFGGVDSSKYTGAISFVPITGTSPSSQFWGIDQSTTYGTSATQILSSTAGIVDTGTTLILLATDAFQAYQKATGATPDQATGLLKIDSPDSLQSLYFNIGDNTYELTPNAQIWPRSRNSEIGGTAGGTYLIVNDLGTPSGQGLDFILGYAFLERFYSVYDTGGKRVGFATTEYTDSTVN